MADFDAGREGKKKGREKRKGGVWDRDDKVELMMMSGKLWSSLGHSYVFLSMFFFKSTPSGRAYVSDAGLPFSRFLVE